MILRPQIGHVGSMRQEIGNFEVSQPHEGGQGQVGGPQVPFLCREDKIETQNLVCREHRKILRLANLAKVVRAKLVDLRYLV